MTQPAPRRFPTPAIDAPALPDDIRTRLLAVQEKSGFVPNVFLTLAYRPHEFRAFFAYHDALMEKDSGLTKAERGAPTSASIDPTGDECTVTVIPLVNRDIVRTWLEINSNASIDGDKNFRKERSILPTLS